MIIEIMIQLIENYLQFIKKMRSICNNKNNQNYDLIVYSCTILHKSQNIIF